MSHHIYQTNAFVLSSTGSGEANKTLLLLTEDLGVVYAAAQGIRLQKSKLKASLQDLSYIKVCLVKGKEVWRLTSAEKLISLYDRRLTVRTRQTLAHILQFVQRMSPGEGKQKDLFEILTKLCGFVFQRKVSSGELVQMEENEFLNSLSIIAKFRILHALGYGSEDIELMKKYGESRWDEELMKCVVEDKKLLEKHVELALRESHL